MNVKKGFERIIISVPALEEAKADYQLLLGTEINGNEFDMENVSIRFEEDPALSQSRVTGLELAGVTEIASESRGLDLRSSAAEFKLKNPSSAEFSRLDHVVLMTTDADDCIRLFNKDLGLRLALDRDAPQWNGRFVFFREGKLTLEVIQRYDKPPAQDKFWGLAYQCSDIDTAHARLTGRGVEMSEIREGRKEGTRVATILSHTQKIPSLLIGPA